MSKEIYYRGKRDLLCADTLLVHETECLLTTQRQVKEATFFSFFFLKKSLFSVKFFLKQFFVFCHFYWRQWCPPCSIILVSKETYYSVKRDLLQCQKRPTTVSKETYYSVKRDLLPLLARSYDHTRKPLHRSFVQSPQSN